MYDQGGGLWELAASPFRPGDAVNACDFDTAEEALWVGTEGGLVGQLAAPALERYSSAAAHEGRVLDLRAVGEGAVSVSGALLCLHASGGLVRTQCRNEVRGRTPGRGGTGRV